MTKQSKVKIFLIKIFKIFTYINKIIPKNTRRIVLYSNLGFRDNVKAIYCWLIDNNYNETYKIICSTNDYKVYRNNKNKNVKFVNNYIGLFYFLCSKYFLYSFGKYPIKPSKKQVVVNLWHGMPLKKIGNLCNGEEKKDNDYFTYLLATSEFFKNIMVQAFGCDEKKVIICGQPRNDDLNKDWKLNYKEENEKLIMWMPTFRKGISKEYIDINNNNPLPIFRTKEELDELNEILFINNIKLFIKLHPLQDTSNLIDCNYSNIYLYTSSKFESEKLELYKVLGSADALITDYSSVYFDYLLLNRPIAFTVDDMEQYSNGRGFVFSDPEKYMPGEKIHTKEEFYNFLRNISLGIDEYFLDRERVNNIVNAYKGFSSCEKIVDFIGIKK